MEVWSWHYSRGLREHFLEQIKLSLAHLVVRGRVKMSPHMLLLSVRLSVSASSKTCRQRSQARRRLHGANAP
jgi:hypothetical protein